MPDSALYFPYIDVPESRSIWGVLLYWDKLGSIIPERIRGDVSSWTRELIDTELVTPIVPRRYLHGRAESAFADGFAELLDMLPDQWPPAPPISIHIQKGGPRAWELLEERGLAQHAIRTARRGWPGDF